MSRVYRQTYTHKIPKEAEVVIKNGKKVAKFKNRKGKPITALISKDGKNVIREASRWYVAYKDENNVWHYVPGSADRVLTERYAQQLDKDVERIRCGLGPPKHMQPASSLVELLDDFRKHLQAKGTSAKQVREKYNRNFQIIKACGFEKWSDMAGSQVEHFLMGLHNGTDDKRSRAARTVNGYLESIKHFCSWLQKEKHAPYSPVAHLCCLNGNTDRRHIRRALTVEECRNLLSVTKEQPERFGMSGCERTLLYRVALESGRRANEIKTLTIGRCNLESVPPTLTIWAGYSKKRKERVQPIPPDLAIALKEYVGKRKADELLFPNMPDIRFLARILRKDLEAAGIPYKDQEGHVVDFHALRHTYATNLTRSGVHPKIAMDLLDHSDINLTMAYYSHTDVKERAKALIGLPNLNDNS